MMLSFTMYLIHGQLHTRTNWARWCQCGLKINPIHIMKWKLLRASHYLKAEKAYPYQRDVYVNLYVRMTSIFRCKSVSRLIWCKCYNICWIISTYTQRKKLSTSMFFWNDKWYDKYHEFTDQIISRTQWWPVRTLYWL